MQIDVFDHLHKRAAPWHVLRKRHAFARALDDADFFWYHIAEEADVPLGATHPNFSNAQPNQRFLLQGWLPKRCQEHPR